MGRTPGPKSLEVTRDTWTNSLGCDSIRWLKRKAQEPKLPSFPRLQPKRLAAATDFLGHVTFVDDDHLAAVMAMPLADHDLRVFVMGADADLHLISAGRKNSSHAEGGRESSRTIVRLDASCFACTPTVGPRHCSDTVPEPTFSGTCVRCVRCTARLVGDRNA